MASQGGALTVDRVQFSMFLDGVVAERLHRKKRYFPAAENSA
jgi:hypothetical protein